MWGDPAFPPQTTMGSLTGDPQEITLMSLGARSRGGTSRTRWVLSLCPVLGAERGLAPKTRAVGVAAGRHCQIPPARVQVLAQELPTEPCPCQCHHRGQHPGDSLSPAWPFQGKTRQNWGWAAAARHLTVCGTVSLQSFP